MAEWFCSRKPRLSAAVAASALVLGSVWIMRGAEHPDTATSLSDRFLTGSQASRGVVVVGEEPVSTNKGRDYALLFATDYYDDPGWPPLRNPVFDAMSLAAVLRETYGFQTEVVTNSTLTNILEKLEKYETMQFGTNDQLLLFFAGHGYFQTNGNEGFTVARDSRLDDRYRINYLAHTRLAQKIDGLDCRHVLVILDTCFGGTFHPDVARGVARGDPYGEASSKEVVQRTLRYRSRLFLTSGAKDYVPDGVPGRHSPFVFKILDLLRGGQGPKGCVTFPHLQAAVETVNPAPVSGMFLNSEAGGGFVLVRRELALRDPTPSGSGTQPPISPGVPGIPPTLPPVDPHVYLASTSEDPSKSQGVFKEFRDRFESAEKDRIHDRLLKKTWILIPDLLNWDNAQNKAKNLGAELPTLVELKTLITRESEGSGRIFINTDYFLRSFRTAKCWTSEGSGFSQRYYVDFEKKTWTTTSKSEMNHVLLIQNK